MFVGRERELAILLKLKEKNVSSLITITGRRRIGKSRLLEEFAKQFKRSYVFSGLAPTEGVSQVEQKAEFCRKLSKYFNWPEFKEQSWADIFSLLARETSRGEVLIIFDEISWMAQNDKLFLSQLKNAWDNEFKKNNKLILAICGSVTSWIEENILSSTGFVGRVSESLKIKELPIENLSKFWGKYSQKVSAFEKIKLLGVTGGVPRYLEEVLPKENAEQNIKRLCFSESGFLFNEFKRLFSDLFSNKQDEYRLILEGLANANLSQLELADKLGMATGGALTRRLEELESLGFLSRDFTWNLVKGDVSKLSKYRVSDNYTRFYLKYILPYVTKIKAGTFPDKGLEFLPAWTSIMGLQFENLILANRFRVYERMGLDARDVVQDGPYFQVKNKKQEGVQIDYLIHQRFNSLMLCEIKAHSQEIGLSIIREVESKISRLNLSAKFSIRPVLISAGPVSSKVYESRYFANIVTGEDLLGSSDA